MGGCSLSEPPACGRSRAPTTTRSAELVESEGATSLYILPGYRFNVVDAMVTNFHVPRSTLLMMVSAFAGRGQVLSAYSARDGRSLPLPVLRRRDAHPLARRRRSAEPAPTTSSWACPVAGSGDGGLGERRFPRPRSTRSCGRRSRRYRRRPPRRRSVSRPTTSEPRCLPAVRARRRTRRDSGGLQPVGPSCEDPLKRLELQELALVVFEVDPADARRPRTRRAHERCCHRASSG